MADVDVQYDPITVNSGPVTVAIAGLNDISLNSKLAITQPIESDARLTLAFPEPIRTDGTLKADSAVVLSIPEPIRTEAKAAIDLQPVVLDQCLRLSLAPLPATRICLPNRQRVAWSVFGIEVFGLTLEGEAQIQVGEPARATHVVGAQTPHQAAGHQAPGAGGLHIRLGG